MSLKILTVDDSKAVRMIVRKAFQSFDCEVVEAANGVEGLAAASREDPQLILLDVTMPVMDGVEMLTKLKSDPSTKAIPVIMLTAEAGKDNVMRIAKIGIRDYIVKPFKEEVLIEKAGRIIDLRPKGSGPDRRKNLSDPCEILLVENKEVIVKQFEASLGHTSWKIHPVSSTGEAIDYCQKQVPDLAVVSLSLPDDAGLTLFRMLRSNVKTKYVPVFSLTVKTSVDAQKNAQTLGFNANITKPIDFDEFQLKVIRALNLDMSEKYFSREEDFLIIRMPEDLTELEANEISNCLRENMSNAVDDGYCKVIIDGSSLAEANVRLIKLLMQIMDMCKQLTVAYVLVMSDKIAEDCKSFEEAREWTFFTTMEEARAGGHAKVATAVGS